MTSAFIESLTSDPLFRGYFFYNAILVIKVMTVAMLTSRQRMKHNAFANPEDAKLKNAKVSTNENVERVRRAHLNDLENIPIYFVACFCYLMTNPAVSTAIWLMRAFTAARILHTIVYAVIPLPQPARGLSFFVGYLVTGFMALKTIMYFA